MGQERPISGVRLMSDLPPIVTGPVPELSDAMGRKRTQARQYKGSRKPCFSSGGTPLATRTNVLSVTDPPDAA
jgi:hypothetical protein